MIDISKAFSQTSEPIAGFFQQPGVGYYIPLFQREYSWESENVEQLMEDIINGVKSLVADDREVRERAIHFMGTVILFQESNPKQNIQPRDDRALPTRIDNVIDGQQRISTIAILASVALQELTALKRKLPRDEKYTELRKEIDSKHDLLRELFSVDIKRGSPSRKPIIIRGSVDGWTFDGKDAENYTSGVSSYLAACIRADEQDDLRNLSKPTDKRVERNVKEIKKWLTKVQEPGPNDDNDYPRASQIIKIIPEEQIWSYPRTDLVELIKPASSLLTSEEKTLASLVQIFAFIHYFAERCCFTVIKPVSEEWAFDMFQSLNASGTPLTAIETFKPLVVNYLAQENKIFKDTVSNEYFSKVDLLIGDTGPTSRKNKLTDEYLVAFALANNGYALSTQFSLQRRYLNDQFKACQTPEEREDFLRRMGDLATYWTDVIGFEPNNDLAVPGLENLDPELKMLSGVSLLFLRESGHKMANTILSRFYSRVLHQPGEDSASDFANACLAVAAFYSLWRSAQSNSGLDDVYRKLLKTGDTSNGITAMSWKGCGDNLSLTDLKSYLLNALGDLSSKEAWMIKAKQNLRFDYAKPVCKFSLFVSAHDTIVDADHPGLMKIGAAGSRRCLDPQSWVSPDFKTIEHIAPVKGAEFWDKALYQTEKYQSIGNLTLLPVEINSSAGNHKWKVKSIYYRHLAETDPSKLAQLEVEAAGEGIELQPQTIDLLKNAAHKHHMAPIVGVVDDDGWNLSLVENRAERICSILWDRVFEWLK